MGLTSPKTGLHPLLLGLLVGLGIGLLVGWVLWPPQYTQAEPALLLPDQKTLYVELVALSFAEDQNRERALGRLHALQEPDLIAYLERIALAHVRQASRDATARAVVSLAQAIGADSPLISQYLSAEPGPGPASPGGQE